MLGAIESFIEINVVLLVYMGIFFVSEKLMKNRLAYSVEERLVFQVDMTKCAAYVFSLLFYLWSPSPYKRIHAIHLALHVLKMFGDQKREFYNIVWLVTLIIYHLFDDYNTTNILFLMTLRELFRCVDVLNILHRQFQWKGLRRNLRVRQASVFGWALVVIIILTKQTWTRTMHWSLLPYMCLLPYRVVYAGISLNIWKEHYK